MSKHDWVNIADFSFRCKKCGIQNYSGYSEICTEKWENKKPPTEK